MLIKHGTNSPGAFYVGSSIAAKLYCGTSLLWTAVDLNDQSVDAAGSTTGGATARARLTSSGLQQSKVGTASYVTDNTWLNGGAASLFDVRFTISSEVGSGGMTGTFGSWLGLGADREVSALASGPGQVYSAAILIEVRANSTGTVIASSTANLDSERF